MISRRSFLSALSVLPFVGKFMPKSHLLTFPNQPWHRVHDAWVPMTVCPEEGGGEIFITSGGRGYIFRAGDPSFPTLAQFSNHDDYLAAFAKWDREVQQPLLRRPPSRS